MSGALEGLKVVEIAAMGPVPFAAMVLADMGAEVARVDRIPKAARPVMPTNAEDRGRLSIALDLKCPASVEAVLALIAQSDVLLEGFRPGVMERLGLGPDACRARNPRLIYGRMTGWGQSGPLAHSAGHDINYLALSGALHAMGSGDRPPTPPLNLVGDYGGGGMLLLVGVLAALHARGRSGAGQTVDAAMAEGAALLMAPVYNLLAQGEWQDRRESNFLDGAAHFYGVYECADGKFVAVGAIEPHFYALLLAKCGIDAAALSQNDPAEWPVNRKKLAQILKTKTRAQWCGLLEGTDACVTPVLSMTEAPMHAQNVSRDAFVRQGEFLHPAPAPRFSTTPSSFAPPAPLTGEHTRALLQRVGLDDVAIEGLIDSGKVYAPPRP